MIGQTISHYRIIEKLGEGGMGIVYKAHDTKLDRMVALKFLPHYLTSDASEKERFYHEARAAAALTHTNIAVIYEIDEHDQPDKAGLAGGQVFIAMEYVEGKTLKKLVEEGPLSLKKVLDIAIQICDGLATAHEKGIVHRDIKSENIMITAKAQVKIMDFGLAKLRGATKLTKTGTTLGTAAYMSPEQAQGEDVDHRSDIFSFGVVLYELLTGRLPFKAEHHAALMYSLINEEPPPVARFNEKVTQELQHIVSKALAKDKEDRYQHVDDLLADLRRERKQLEYAKAGYATAQSVAQTLPVAQPQKQYKKYFILAGTLFAVIVFVTIVLLMRRGSTEAVSTEPSRKALAVLPFENLGAPEQEYFADGLTDEVITRLSGLSGLGVIARASAFQYKESTKTIKQIGEELGVAYLLQGTIRWGKGADGAERLRVNPQLIKVADGTQVWSQSYEAVLSDVFKLQSEIASQVATALDVALLQPERKALEAKPTNNPEAYDAYLRGNDYLHRGYEEKDMRIAEEMFQKAVKLDPNFALGYAQLARSHAFLYWLHYDRTEERVLKAKEAAERALQLAPDHSGAHVAMGYYYYQGRLDYDNALREFDIAKKLQPNNIDVVSGIAFVRRRQGKMEDAITNLLKAVDLDPRASELLSNLAETYVLVRNYSEAERYYDRALSLAPDQPFTYVQKAEMYLLWEGNTAKSRRVLEEAVRKIGGVQHPSIVYLWVTLDMLDQRYDDALRRLSASSAKSFESQWIFVVPELLYAQIYGLMHQPKQERAYYDSARIKMEELVKKQPQDSRFHSTLGIAYAGLGRKQDAIREGKLAVEQLPVSREAYRGAYRVADLARIYAMVGEQDAAVEQLAMLLSIPSQISKPWLRIDPTWIPLHNNPRFQKLLEEKR